MLTAHEAQIHLDAALSLLDRGIPVTKPAIAVEATGIEAAEMLAEHRFYFNIYGWDSGEPALYVEYADSDPDADAPASVHADLTPAQAAVLAPIVNGDL